MAKILFIDNDEGLCLDVCGYLTSAGMQVEHAIDFPSACGKIERHLIDLVIANVELNGGTCKELIDFINNSEVPAVTLIHTEIDSINKAVRAVKEGAFGILSRPFNMPELTFHIKKALEEKDKNLLELERVDCFTNIYQPSSFIGESPEIKDVFHIVNRVAAAKSSVIITGETGTGKELIAGSIHYNSPWAEGPFVRVNCAALPETLLESELFGYERGAFTGADRMRLGRFEQADGGTIFLDEVADMSLYTQAKVLRVLQEREFERVGGNQTVKVDVRIISATNKDLLSMVEEGMFREDLYYRLNVVSIQLPALRDRGEDIELLSNFFIRKYSLEMNKKVPGIHRDALKILTDYYWPGNIRELENTIERTVVMSEGPMISHKDVAANLQKRSRPHSMMEIERGVELDLAVQEKQVILEALEKTGWVQKEAAVILNISNRVLNYKIKKFGIRHSGWRQNK